MKTPIEKIQEEIDRLDKQTSSKFIDGDFFYNLHLGKIEGLKAALELFNDDATPLTLSELIDGFGTTDIIDEFRTFVVNETGKEPDLEGCKFEIFEGMLFTPARQYRVTTPEGLKFEYDIPAC